MAFFEGQTKTINEASEQLINSMEKLNDKMIGLRDEENKLIIENQENQLDEQLLDLEEVKCEKELNDMIDEIKKSSSDDKYTSDKKLSTKKYLYFKYVKNHYIKNNLYQFIQECKKLDSIPEWRANISDIIVSYLSKYLPDPNSVDPNNPTYITKIPTYDTFNLIIMGTPGVGKSFTADIVGKVLKHSGLLTKGDRHDIKKPDIVGSYTGQTAPKVYKEFTECLGKVIFIDEAYSIAGAKDETKGTYNEFGQESLDAITDYTSEHIGFSAFVAAGYEYEMKSQFLDVNIGLPRRFPTQLILNRYALNSFWKILYNYMIKFVKKIHLENHHKACFELQNLLFNFQCIPNPVIKLSKDWSNCWKSTKLRNIKVDLDINLDEDNTIKIPFLELLDFHKKVKNSVVTSETVEELISRDYLKNPDIITKTFIKSFVVYTFCEIFNGDMFRSQADNLTKFSNVILDNKIVNPLNKYNEHKDNNYKFGDTEWIEYCFFSLYFTKNPNQQINNIDYRFDEVNIQNRQTAGYKRSNKKSRNNNKKINNRSRKNEPESIINKIIREINNNMKLKGGNPGKKKTGPKTFGDGIMGIFDPSDDSDIESENEEFFGSYETGSPRQDSSIPPNFPDNNPNTPNQAPINPNTPNQAPIKTDPPNQAPIKTNPPNNTTVKPTPVGPSKLLIPGSKLLIPMSDSDDSDDEDDDIKNKQNKINNFKADELYEKGLEFFNKSDYKQALTYFNKAIEISKTHGNCLYMLGKMYIEQLGIVKSIDPDTTTMGLNYYSLSSKFGNTEAQYIMGFIYNYIYAYKQINDPDEQSVADNLSVEIYKTKVDLSKDDLEEMNETKHDILTKYHIDPDIDIKININVDPEKEFINMFKKVIKSCYFDGKAELKSALYLLTRYYLENNKEDEAIKYLKKSIEQNSLKANITLANIYVKHNDIPNAVQYYDSAARLGDVDIQIMLGDWYNNPMHIEEINSNFKDFFEKERKLDYYKSMEYYKMALNNTKDDMNSELIETKYELAKQGYETYIFDKLFKSVDKNDRVEQFKIGTKFLEEGLKYQGLNLIKKSADNEYAEACFKQGKIIYDTLDIFNDKVQLEKDTEEMKKYFEIACRLEYKDAIWFYADILFNGIKIRSDKKRAVDLYRKGAELGDVKCQLVYATLLINNNVENGVERNDYQAVMYLRMAVENDETNTTAQALLSKLDKEERGMRDLSFSCKISFDKITNVNNILIDISESLKTDDKSSTETINPIFNKFNEDNVIYRTEYDNNNYEPFKQPKFIHFIKVYILLKCYVEVLYQLNQPDQKFNRESWWFFKLSHFSTILEDFDIKSIMETYNNLYQNTLDIKTNNPETDTKTEKMKKQ